MHVQQGEVEGFRGNVGQYAHWLRMQHEPISLCQVVQHCAYHHFVNDPSVCARAAKLLKNCVHAILIAFFVYVRVCVCGSERERERERERDGHSVQPFRNRLNRGLFANTYEHHQYICHATLFPSRLELMVKLRTLLTVFTFILKAETLDYGKRHHIFDAACGVRQLSMHCASWPIRADYTWRKEGLCRKLSVWERRGIEELQ